VINAVAVVKVAEMVVVKAAVDHRRRRPVLLPRVEKRAKARPRKIPRLLWKLLRSWSMAVNHEGDSSH
jgi:hypothetical protein